MIKYLQNIISHLGAIHQLTLPLSFISLFLFVILLAWLANFISKRYIVMFARLLITKAKESWANKIVENKVLEKLSHIAPALVIYSLAPLFNIKGLEFTETIEYIQKTLALLYIIATLTYTAIAGLDSIEDIYETYDVAKKKTY